MLFRSKSSADYIIRKAAQSSIFYLPQEVHKSPLDRHIETEAEKRYKPSTLEKNTGYVLGSTADLLCMGGFGGGFKTAATWIGGDIIVNNVVDRTDIPSVIAPGHEEEYRKLQAQKKTETPKPKAEPKPEPKAEEPVQEQKPEETQASPSEAQQQNPEQSNTSGWAGLLTSFGLNGLGDITHNLGYVLAMQIGRAHV